MRWLETIEKGVIPFQFQHLSALRGFWPLGSADENGDAYDLSEQDRVLSYNGNPTYNFDNLAPYIDLDGTGDFLSRADEAGLDILGTETTIASAIRGLTIGGWFWTDGLGAAQFLIAKWNAATNNRSYSLFNSAANRFEFNVSVDGTAVVTVTDTIDLTANNWFFVVGRFDPSTSLDIFVNGRETNNVAAIPASIFNSNADLQIGAAQGVSLLDGRASFNFLCAAQLSDAIISALFQQSRSLFGV